MACEIHYNLSLLSDRLQMVPVVKAHAADMFTVLSDTALYQYTGDSPPESLAAVSNWFSAIERRRSVDTCELWLTWLLIRKEGRTAIGYVQATVVNTRADIAWLVGTQWQGKGYASEAACAVTWWLNINNFTEICALIHPDHLASQVVAGAAGLHYSGRIEDGEEIWLN